MDERIFSRGAVIGAALALAVSVPPAVAAETTPIGVLRLSAAVAEHGRAAREPLALIVAASLRRSVAIRPIERAPEGGAPEPAAADGPTVESLLAEAVAMSRSDPTIVAMAEDVAASATKGRVTGVATSVATVPAAGTDWYRKVRFEGTRYAETWVELVGDGRVHVAVYDDQGNLVCRDANPSSVAYCGWTPSTTATFDVKVENLGTRPVRYRIATN